MPNRKETPTYSNEHPMNPASLATMEEHLRKGLRMHAFRSGGGLRVVRMEDRSIKETDEDYGPGFSLQGYGEHYCVEVAFDHTAEDLKAGHQPYNKQYGEDGHTHYLSGTLTPNSQLDLWLLQGHMFDAYVDKDEVVFELHGYEETEYPEGVEKRALAGEVVLWENRGYIYETKLSNFRGSAPGTSTSVVKSPEGKRSGSDPWMYKIIKTGRASTLILAIEAAFKAPSIEKP